MDYIRDEKIDYVVAWRRNYDFLRQNTDDFVSDTDTRFMVDSRLVPERSEEGIDEHCDRDSYEWADQQWQHEAAPQHSHIDTLR